MELINSSCVLSTLTALIKVQFPLQVSVLVRHDLQQYHEIKDKPGDAFYVRAGFDRCAKITSIGMDTVDEYSLWFRYATLICHVYLYPILFS